MTADFRKFVHGTADAAALLGALFTVAGLFGKHHHVIEFFTHFKLVLAVCFAGYIAFKLIFKCRKTAYLCVIPLLLNAVPPLMLFLPQNNLNPQENPVRITILQANVLSSNRDSEKLLALIEDFNPEIIVLQEINRRWVRKLSSLKKEYPVFAEHPREDNFGAAIFCRTTNAVATIEFLSDPHMLPISKVLVKKGSRNLTILGVHPLAPISTHLWKWRNAYILELSERLAESEGPIILTGDLNNTPWGYYYKQFIKKSGLLDSSQGRGPLPTWPAGRAMLPLDHCLHSKDVVIKTRKRGPDIGSDHYPLIIEAEY